MRYELDTIYAAFVSIGKYGCARLYFIFDYDYHRVTVKDAYDVDWHIFPLDKCTEIRHECNIGSWRLANGTTWTFVLKGVIYSSTVKKADDKDPVVKADLHGKHLNMVDAAAYSLKTEYMGKIEDDIKRGIRNECGIPRRYMRTGIITNITEGGEKVKSLYHVILFNRKTEEIDFKAYIPAAGEIEAGMTAAHNYDKYDGKVHMHIVKHISIYDAIK